MFVPNGNQPVFNLARKMSEGDRAIIRYMFGEGKQFFSSMCQFLRNIFLLNVILELWKGLIFTHTNSSFRLICGNVPLEDSTHMEVFK